MHVVCRGFVRFRAVAPHRQGGGGEHPPEVGATVCGTVAESTGPAPGWHPGAAGQGTPQGSPVSPLLANLFMHYGFDLWMVREFPTIPFERFCDDVVVHCVSEKQARYVRERIAARLGELGLRLHPDKTRIIFCGRTGRESSYEHTSFTLLGYEFRKRAARAKGGGVFNGFLPGVSRQAIKK